MEPGQLEVIPLNKHRGIQFCAWCGEPIPAHRQSIDPPEFFCCSKHETYFRIRSGLGSTLDMVWPDGSYNYNPSLVLVRAGQKDIPGDRMFRRIVLKVRRIDADLWKEEEENKK